MALLVGCESSPSKKIKKDITPTKLPKGMVWIPEGQFLMGSEGPQARPDEGPLHTVKVNGFWIDQTEVTNAQFASFVKATGYITTAEKSVDWEEMKKQLPPGTPKPHDSILQPGSLIFNKNVKATKKRTETIINHLRQYSRCFFPMSSFATINFL